MRGVKPREVLMYWGGDERGNDFSGPPHDFAWCVPIGTQCLHAAGAALAFKLRGEPRVAVACVGDGGSSKTDTYAAINAAGAYTLPLRAVHHQQPVGDLGAAQGADRRQDAGAEGHRRRPGMPAGGRQRHHRGAWRRWTTRSSARATAMAAACIEFVTYRLSDHTTADDARRYRDDARGQGRPGSANRSCACATYLIDAGLWDEDAGSGLEGRVQRAGRRRGQCLSGNHGAAGRGDVRLPLRRTAARPRRATRRSAWRWEKR